MQNHHRLSFEFFPSKTDVGLEKLKTTCQQLNQFNPEFFSVTYGAGGSTRDTTLKVVNTLLATNVAVAPHLSFGNDSTQSILELIQQYQTSGIKRIVALRGDTPSGTGIVEPVYAQQLIQFIREKTGDHFHIEVAAYPEMHPQAESYDKDIYYLKQKFDAGANTAITQYFYNVDAYFYFIDACTKQGIEQNIIPGIMPITNFTNLKRFSKTCGADIPRWISKRIEAFADDQVSINDFGTEVVSKMCQQLLAGGAPGLHFYTMNQFDANAAILNNL